MRTRERAIMDYTHRMAEADRFHADTLYDLTNELLNYLQNQGPRLAIEREVAEEQWRQGLLDAYYRWNKQRNKAQADLDAALAADPAIES